MQYTSVGFTMNAAATLTNVETHLERQSQARQPSFFFILLHSGKH